MTWWKLVFVGLAGCSGSEPADETGGDSAPEPDGCSADVIEDDFVLYADAGPAGDPVNWAPLPPTAIVAMTYLRLQPSAEGQAAFQESVGPVVETLAAPAAGLMGVSTGASARCGTARTLTVWQDEESLFAFVASDAHVAAMSSTPEISRGGSITSRYVLGDLAAVDWETVAARFVEHDGPVY